MLANDDSQLLIHRESKEIRYARHGGPNKVKFGLGLMSIVGVFYVGNVIWNGVSRSAMRLQTQNFWSEDGQWGVKPSAANCTTHWFDQHVDHFAWGDKGDEYFHFKQRYLINDRFWRNTTNGKKGPIFFYCGNEGDVTLYANHTGLMWENAERFGALLVFAEHRYYGRSLISDNDTMKYLTHEQALADYARLIKHLKINLNAHDSQVIAFGGSYGGMLAAWFRMKYPSIIDGAISASAPILMFKGQRPEYQGESYWQIVTRDATAACGSSSNCVNNVRRLWRVIFSAHKTEVGRTSLSTAFKLCSPLDDSDDGSQLAMFVMMAFDTMAMGNYPYPSNYMTSGDGEMPAWPMKEACFHLAGELPTDSELLKAMAEAVGVYYNASKSEKCFHLPSLQDFDGVWDYQWCTEMLPQETYFDTDGEHDMFWKRTIDPNLVRIHCNQTWGVVPRPEWISIEYGGIEALNYTSNIVFSNGLLDPWSSGGVLKNVSDSVIAVNIPEGAHHLDLFFSNKDDPPSVINARNIQLAQIEKWIAASNGLRLNGGNDIILGITFIVALSVHLPYIWSN